MKKKRRDPFGFEFFNDDIFEDFLNQIREMTEMMEDEFGKGKTKHYVRGISIKIGDDGKPIVREFGNKIGENKQINEIEPLVDVMEEDKIVRIIAEVPGAEEKDIEISETKDGIEIKSNGPKRYHKNIRISIPVDYSKMKKKCKNGILEIELPKK